MGEAGRPTPGASPTRAPRVRRDEVRVYTRQGDAGTTSLRIGGRVGKDDPHIELVGAIDEAQAFLGLARAEASDRPDLAERLVELERDLWILMAQAATPFSAADGLVPGETAVTPAMVSAMEAEIDKRIANDELPAAFTVPGENRLAATLDVARTVVRRAERVAVADGLLAPVALAYLNRLSDLCWVLRAARRATTGFINHPDERGRPSGCYDQRGEAGSALREVVMSLVIAAASSLPSEVDAIAFGVFDGLETAAGRRSIDETIAKRRGFSGALGESMVRDAEDGRLEIAVGLGRRERFDAEALRRAGAAAARAAKKCETLAIELAGLDSNGVDAATAARAVGEGAALAVYRYDRFRSKPSEDGLRSVVLVHPSGVAVAAAEAATVVGEVVSLCRDLINTPAGDLSPSDFADIARDVAARNGLAISVFEAEQILEEGLGGLLGVAAGSIQPPRLVRLVYEPEGVTSPPTVALVGKGITFDSGGLSIKPAASMMTMKEDMSGAAAVLATMAACGRLGVKVRVIGFMPLTENMPGGSATKPGDVLRTRNGKTIEVLNTDAEGRLVLADALSLAVEEQPDSIIDLATLTGACVVALGKQIAGLLGNDDELIGLVTAAGETAGEASWPLPIPAGYHSHIDSEVADMKNIGATGQAGTLSAALLLQEFVGAVPWAHLDIAGPAWSDEDKGYIKKGGTGFGVRTLLALLDGYQALGREVSGEAKGIRVLR